MLTLFHYTPKRQIDEIHIVISNAEPTEEIQGEYTVVILKPGGNFVCTRSDAWPYYNQDWVAYHVKHTSTNRDVSQFIADQLPTMKCVKSRGVFASMPLIGWMFITPYVRHEPELLSVTEAVELTMAEAIASILNATNVAFCNLYCVPAAASPAGVETSLSLLSGKKGSGVTRVPLSNKPVVKKALPVIPE